MTRPIDTARQASTWQQFGAAIDMLDDELHAYLVYGRTKCRTTTETLTDEQAKRRCRFGWGEASFAELLLYAMRHVQEHAAQLNLFLGQRLGWDSGWVARARQKHHHE